MSTLQVHRTENREWLSNAYLVVNPDTRQAVLIDGNGVSEPLLNRITTENIEVAAILLTHHHIDHVDIGAYASLKAPLLAHPETAALAGLDRPAQPLADGEIVRAAGLRVDAIYTPGHASDHIAYLVNDEDCFTADLLFHGTVGGTRGPGATTLQDLRRSLSRILMLAPGTRLHPGHATSTTVGTELVNNPFVAAWREGREPPEGKPCTVAGEPATLLLWGPDYDGTNKAWVRLADGVEHVVGGSQVVR